MVVVNRNKANTAVFELIAVTCRFCVITPEATKVDYDIGTLSGVGLVVAFAPFYLSTVKHLGEWLEMEKVDAGIRMPMSDSMVREMSDESYQQLHVDWLELVDKVRRELKARESGG